MINNFECEKAFAEEYVRRLYVSQGQPVPGTVVAEPASLAGSAGASLTVGSSAVYYKAGSNGDWDNVAQADILAKEFLLGALTLNFELAAYTSGTFRVKLDVLNVSVGGALITTPIIYDYMEDNLRSVKPFNIPLIGFHGLRLQNIDVSVGVATIQLSAKFDGWRVNVY